MGLGLGKFGSGQIWISGKLGWANLVRANLAGQTWAGQKWLDTVRTFFDCGVNMPNLLVCILYIPISFLPTCAFNKKDRNLIAAA